MNGFSDVDWEDVLYTLEEQKCILFLGSSAIPPPGGGSLDEALVNWLDARDPNHPFIRLYNPDGFFLFRKNRYKRKVINSIQSFYNRPFPEAMEQFGVIAQIPFTVLLTLTPDNLLARAFDQTGFEYSADFYFRQRNAAQHFERPHRDKPLIYNLLGNIEEPESLVLTHSDFFDYLESIFNKHIHEELLSVLENAERYIFLGLPYEKWYFQLLLRWLSIDSDKLKEVERLALQEFEESHLKKLYTAEFKLEFIPTGIAAFLQELHQQCKSAGILKEASTVENVSNRNTEFSPEEVRSLIAKARTEEAMQYLKRIWGQSHSTNFEKLNDLLVLRNRYHLLKQREIRGTIYPQDLVVENQQIIEQLLHLLPE